MKDRLEEERSRRLTRREALRLLCGAGATMLLAACGNVPPPGGGAAPGTPAAEGAADAEPTQSRLEAPPEPTPVPRSAASGRATTLEVWYPYGGANAPLYEEYWKGFEDSHPDIGIKAVYAANDLSTNAKLFTAIAGGKPPDVTWVDGPQVAEWAARGALEPLDDLIGAAGITKESYWAPSWDQCVYEGKTWALTYGSDPNFGFFWNKDVFAESGLDPEQPPATIAEMDQMAEKIAKVEGGRIDRLGHIPWTVYGASNSLFTWGWAFGGEFYDPATKKISANHPKVVQALEWMVEFAKKYDPTKISGFQAGFGTGEQNPFFQGKISMAPFGPWELSNFARYAPNVKFGITFLPTGPDGAPPRSSWVGGWTIGIPKGVKNREAAFEFVKWMSTDDTATTIAGKTFNQFPGFKNAPYYAEVQKDEQLKAFYDILVETRHQRPVMPAQAFYTGSLARAVDAAVFGEKTPQQALDDATAETQKELDRILAEGIPLES
jgi:multiple sugar transport system substrate-binding protein